MSTINDVVVSMRMMFGDTEAVAIVEGVAALYAQAISDRDEARASEAAARAALDAARGDAAVMASKLAVIFEDLQDGVYDGPPVVVEPAPAPVEEPVVVAQ